MRFNCCRIWLALLAGLFFVSCHTQQKLESPPVTALAVIQGFTDRSSSQMAILHPRNLKLNYGFRLKGSNDLIKPVATRYSFSPEGAKQQVDRIEVVGLEPDKDYLLEIHGPEGQLIDQREFQALSLEGAKPTVAIVSCLDDGFEAEQKKAWLKVLESGPNLILMIGDNVYADKYLGPVPVKEVNPQQLWERYVATREKLDVFRWRKLVPILAVWDDHDFGSNNGGGSYSFKVHSAEIFRAFFPQEPRRPSLEAGPGVAQRLTAFGVDWYFLDDRFFRSEENSTEHGEHLGSSQIRWLKENLSQSKRPVVLIEGDQFFGAHHKFESFAGSHPRAFAKFKDLVRSVVRQPILLVSGDRHLLELQKIPKNELGQETYELTTSALHARTFPGALNLAPSPYFKGGRDGVLNFGILKNFKISSESWQLRVEGHSVDDGPIFGLDLTLKGQRP